MKISRTAIIFALIGLAVIFLPFFLQQPFPYAFDSYLHIRYTKDFAMAFADDPGYPDWYARIFDGQGSPVFRYLAPLPHFISIFLQMLGLSGHLALKFCLLLYAAVSLAALRRYDCDRETSDNGASLFFIISNPFLAVFLHFAFQFQNLCAYFVIPWAINGLCKALKNQPGAWHTLTAAIAVMACTHLQITLITFYALLAAGLFWWLSHGKSGWRPLFTLGMAGFAALLIASPYIFPTMLTKHLTHFEGNDNLSLRPGGRYTPFLDSQLQLKNEQTLPITHGFKLIFPFISQLTANGKPDLYLQPSEIRFEFFRPWIFALSLMIMCVGLINLFKGKPTICEKVLTAIGLAITLMNYSPSAFLWRALPGIYLVQFPWRCLIPGSIFIFAGSASLLDRFWQKRPAFFTLLLIVPWLTFAFIFTVPSKPMPEGTLETFYKRTGYLPFVPVTVPKLSLLADKNQGGIYHKAFLGAEKNYLEPIDKGYSWAEYQFLPASATRPLNILTHFDPFWRLSAIKADSSETSLDITASAEDGTILTQLPAETTGLRFFRVRPTWRLTGYLLASLTLIFWLTTFSRLPRRAPDQEKDVK